MTDVRPFYLSGVPTFGEKTVEVTSPYTGEVVATVSLPTADQVEQAVAELYAVRHEALARLPGDERSTRTASR